MLPRNSSPLRMTVCVMGAISAFSMTNAMSVEDSLANEIRFRHTRDIEWLSKLGSWISDKTSWLTKEAKEELAKISGYSFHRGPPTPIKVPACDMKNGDCSMAKIKSNENTVIYPGQNTQCLNSTTPFYFQVIPGNSKGLLIYFAGGGACWSNETNGIGSCYGNKVLASRSPEVVQGPYHGVFDKSNPKNPFADYTIVSISYCSGDVHVGDTKHTYENIAEGGAPVVIRQAGKDNTMAALSWIKQNIPEPDKLVVMGCSAGAIAAELWGGFIGDMYAGNAVPPVTAVVADSYAGIFPASQAKMFDVYGITRAPFTQKLPAPLLDKVKNGTMYFCEMTNALHQIYSNVSYLAVQSKADVIQTLFYDAVSITLGDGSEMVKADAPQCALESIPPPRSILAPDDFYNAVVGMYKSYSKPNNFAPYLINSMYHCFTCFDRFYTTEIRAEAEHFWQKKPRISLVDWLKQATLPKGGVETDLTGKCETGGYHTGGNWLQSVMFSLMTCPTTY